MNTYKVQCRVSHLVNVEVRAESEASAMEMAAKDARFGRGGTPYSEEASAIKVLAMGKNGRPAMAIPTDWQIYSSMPGAISANKAITEAVAKVAENLAQLAEKGDLCRSRIKDQVVAHLHPLFKRYEKFGTYDSEPGDQVAMFLASWCKSIDRSLDREAIADVIDGSL
jgi:hypothetical protein